MASPARAFRIGVISGSQRKPRVGPQVADFVTQTIQAHLSASPPASASFTFDRIDVGALALPLYDEPGLPSRIQSADGYAHEHTRRWSRRVAALDGFVFVTPQYNWGVPAGLKNAIDYLFHEWRGKPAVIVSYGGHGGGKAAAHLSETLHGGIRMLAGQRMVVSLSFPSQDVTARAVAGQDLGLDAASDDGVWSAEREGIKGAWDEMVGLLTRESAAEVASR